MILISGRVSLLKSIHKIMNIFLRAYGAKQTLFNHGLATWSTNIYVHVNRGLVIASADLAQRRSSRGSRQIDRTAAGCPPMLPILGVGDRIRHGTVSPNRLGGTLIHSRTGWIVAGPT